MPSGRGDEKFRKSGLVDQRNEKYEEETNQFVDDKLQPIPGDFCETVKKCSRDGFSETGYSTEPGSDSETTAECSKIYINVYPKFTKIKIR